LRAGIGRADITPPVGIEIGIWTLRRGLSTGVHDRMWARALVLEDDDTCVAITSLDVAALTRETAEAIRDVVTDRTNIGRQDILLNCSHTHTSPFTRRLPSSREEPTAGHLAHNAAFPHYVAGAIIEAWHQRREAAIGADSTSIQGVTVNRRDPKLPVDPELGLIRIDDRSGRPMACLVNYACHGTTVGAHFLDWTADYPGYLARVVEDAIPGCTCLFLQGAEGDIHPWDWYFGNPNPRFGDEYEGAERLGKAIAGPALGLVNQIETGRDVTISTSSEVVGLPPRPISWTAEDAEAYFEELEATLEPYEGDVIPNGCPGCMSAQHFPNAYKLSAARKEAEFAREYPDVVDVELMVVQIGDIVLAANSGELYNELGREIKQRSPFDRTYVLSCTNDYTGYIPSRDAIQAVLDLPLAEFVDPVKHRKHYGATSSNRLAPGAGEMMVEKALGMIGQA
jgi:hypothetical protein